MPDQLTIDGGVLMNYQSATEIAANRGITLGPAGRRTAGGLEQYAPNRQHHHRPRRLRIADDNGTVILANTANSFAGAARSSATWPAD